MNKPISRARGAALSLATAVLAACTAAGLAGCENAGAQGAPGKPDPNAPAAVTAATVVEKPVALAEEYSGRLEAVEHVNIRPRVSGHLTAVHVTPGALVKRGQLLFEIDPAPFKAEVERGEASLLAVRADLELAKLELERARRLAAERAIAQREVEERAAAVQKLDAQQRAARAALQAARLNLAYTRIEAPIDGRVSRAEVTRGNLVDPNVVLSSVVSRQIYASFDADEAAFLRVAPAARAGRKVEVEVALAGEQGFPHRAKLESIDNRFERATGSVRMRALLEGGEELLAPGLFARVRLGGNLTTGAKALLVAERAVGTDQSRKFVVVVGGDGKAEYRPVTLGPVVDGLRVIATGLKPGETVVVDGLQRVKPGQALKAKLEQMAALGPATGAAGAL
jgi:multidrug efflux system membrane fusion protein